MSDIIRLEYPVLEQGARDLSVLGEQVHEVRLALGGAAGVAAAAGHPEPAGEFQRFEQEVGAYLAGLAAALRSGSAALRATTAAARAADAASAGRFTGLAAKLGAPGAGPRAV